MKRDAPKGVPPYAPPAKQRDSRSLRAQLTRAVGDAFRAVGLNGARSALPSKQRLTDMLWNDRTLLASSRAASAADAREVDEVTNPRGSVIEFAVALERAADAPVEVASDREVAAWFDAALEEPVVAKPDPEASEAFAAALESAAAEVARRRTPTPPQLQPKPLRSKSEVPAPPPAAAVEIPPPVAPSPPPAAVEISPPVAPQPVAARPRRLSPPPTAAKAPVTPKLVAPPPSAAPPVARTPAPEPPEEDDGVTEEPIRTRSMARLLAGQGHRQRALRIYDALIAADANDASLRAEADALRRQAGS